jgi:hypothetical protein
LYSISSKFVEDKPTEVESVLVTRDVMKSEVQTKTMEVEVEAKFEQFELF